MKLVLVYVLGRVWLISSFAKIPYLLWWKENANETEFQSELMRPLLTNLMSISKKTTNSRVSCYDSDKSTHEYSTHTANKIFSVKVMNASEMNVCLRSMCFAHLSDEMAFSFLISYPNETCSRLWSIAFVICFVVFWWLIDTLCGYNVSTFSGLFSSTEEKKTLITRPFSLDLIVRLRSWCDWRLK